MMNIESLPNEIFVECFGYLHLFDLLHSFNDLNARFHQLIRCIFTHLDFQSINARKFFQFCILISTDHQLREHIRSIRLSNRYQQGQIITFLWQFSPVDLSHLRSLTLIQTEIEDFVRLKSLLPSMTNLNSFHLIAPRIDDDQILSLLPKYHLRKLTIANLQSFIKHTQQPTVITHLIVCSCSLEQLSSQLFQSVPLLKYLNLGYVKKVNQPISNSSTSAAICYHLKHLIIGQMTYSLEQFGHLFKQTPNLQHLTIDADFNLTMIDADYWEYLINTFIPHLTIFQFRFLLQSRFIQSVATKYRQFFRPFWIKQRQWYTRLLVDNRYLHVYTLPYHSIHFTHGTDVYIHGEHEIISEQSRFDRVTHLSITLQQNSLGESAHFPNVFSLKFITSAVEPARERMSISSLKSIVNLTNVTHLDISTNRQMITPAELLQILKESPRISSLNIDPSDLIILSKNKHLIQLFNSMIKNLSVYRNGHHPDTNLDELKLICKMFSHLEKLICNVNQPKHILFFFFRLRHLQHLHVFLSPSANVDQTEMILKKLPPNYGRGRAVRMLTSEVTIWTSDKTDE